MYAKLIRGFTYRGLDSQRIHELTYYQIQASRKSRTLFPNLVESYCRHGDDALEEVYFFLSPFLRRVVIFNDTPQYSQLFSPSVSFFVNAMPEICPDIQSLEVYGDLPISALRSVQKLKKLQYLGLNVLPPQSSNDDIAGLSLAFRSCRNCNC